MKLHRILLAFLFFQFYTEVKAQWSVKHLYETEYTWNNLVKFKSDSLGLFMGNNSVILKSIDTGESWNPIVQSTKIDLHDFQFVGDSVVFAVGDVSGGSQLIKSLDNGDSWDSIAFFPKKQLWSLSFQDIKTGFVAGYDGIYRTTDSGNHWNLVWSVPQFGYQYGELKQICFPTPQVGYAIGQGRTQSGAKNNFDNFFLKTTDSGLSWDTICTLKYSLASMFFQNADTGFIGTVSPNVLKTTDGGHSWIEKTITDSSPINSIQFISDKKGFAAGGHINELTGGGSGTGMGDSFFISKTIDCGDTWETYNSAGIPLNSIYFINDTTGFVSGMFGLIMKTTGAINGLPADYPWHLVDDGSAVKDIDDTDALVKAFPNPTTGLLTLQLKNLAHPIESIRLLSTSGQLIDVGKPKLNSENIQIDLSRLVSGIYFIQITFSNKTELIKVVKK